ncbi:lysozyme C, milk isozyme-like [Anabrus simplex]|uniref:lysozyme C, milk isozyme-like n=1 Tax=Anabrus simplex TaxID=316456 RepID=UPI0035A2DDF2
MVAQAKIYERCELARELRNRGIPGDQLATWVCIANFESSFNTNALGTKNADGSKDHGLFQISDLWWCTPGPRNGCNIKCSQFHNDDISDDLRCAQKIYEERKRLFGDGFTAWTVYQPNCSGRKAARFVNGCF